MASQLVGYRSGLAPWVLEATIAMKQSFGVPSAQCENRIRQASNSACICIL
jgi:hypothetical protein